MYKRTFVFKCLNPICICYLFEFKYFNYLYKKKYKINFSKKGLKSNTISCTKGQKKKKCYSYHAFVFKYLSLIYIFYLFVFKYFNYLLNNNKKNIKNYFKKKKNPTTSCKNY